MNRRLNPLVLLTLALWLVAGLTAAPVFAEDKSASKESEATERATNAEALRRRAEAAEERARAAEEAAKTAADEARLARQQAELALETARQLNERLRQMQDTLARMAGNDAPDAIVAAAPLKETKEAKDAAESNAVESPEASQPARPSQMAQAPAGDVRSASRLPVQIYGSLLFNANYVSGGTNNIDVPLFALKAGSPPDQNHQNVNMTARQSRFGMRYEGRIFGDAKLTGVFDFDLFGGKPAFPNGQHFDIFRLRLAYGRIDWLEDSIEAGQDWAVFAPLNPTSLASFAIPAFAGSGNLWIRSPQIRYEHREEIGQRSQFIFTTALLDPNAGDNSNNPVFRSIGLGERSSLPAFESRIGFVTPTAAGRDSSFGLSGHYSRLLGVLGSPLGTTEHSPIDSYGVASDVTFWLNSGMRLSGEAFHGRALGTFSGGVVQSAVVRDGRARGINSTGGWLEMHFEAPIGYDGAWRDLSFNTGFGMENNRDEDLLAGLRKRNRTFMANGQYRFSPRLTLGLEYRFLRTDFFREPSARRNIHWFDTAFLFTF